MADESVSRQVDRVLIGLFGNERVVVMRGRVLASEPEMDEWFEDREARAVYLINQSGYVHVVEWYGAAQKSRRSVAYATVEGGAEAFLNLVRRAIDETSTERSATDGAEGAGGEDTARDSTDA